MRPRRHVLCFASLAALGCGQAPTPAVVLQAPQHLALPAPSLARCTPRIASERILGAGQEGALWSWEAGALFRTDRGGTRMRMHTLASTPTQLVDHGSGTVTVLVDGALIHLTEGAQSPVALPADFGTPLGFCGSSAPGDLWLASTSSAWWHLPTGGGVFQRFGESEGTLMRSTLRPELSGACTSGSSALWMPSEEGIYRFDIAARTLTLDPGASTEGFSARGARYAYVASNMVWLRETETMARYAIDGTVSRTQLTDDFLWVQLLDGLLRVMPSTVRAPNEETLRYFEGAETFYADADGGAWFERSDVLCRVEAPGALEVRGVSVDARIDASMTRPVEASRTGSALQLLLDGTSLATGQDRVSATLPTTQTGWHWLEVRAEEETLRRIPFESVNTHGVGFASDIAPALTTHCASCHGEGGMQAQFMTYERFRAQAERARLRVAQGSMPPAPAAPPEGFVTLVGRWIDGGMQP